jgi:hypothetical protein
MAKEGRVTIVLLDYSNWPGEVLKNGKLMERPIIHAVHRLNFFSFRSFLLPRSFLFVLCVCVCVFDCVCDNNKMTTSSTKPAAVDGEKSTSLPSSGRPPVRPDEKVFTIIVYY